MAAVHDEEKFDGPVDKSKVEQLEASAGKVNNIAPYDRPAHWVDIDPAAEAKLRWKIDLRIIPLVTLLYLLNFIDRAAIGNARVAGFEKDTGLKGNEFYYSLTIFYVFYILVEVPSNEIFRRFGSMWLAFLVILFGIVSIATAFVNNLAGVIVTRIFLGLAEGGLLPGIAYLLSRYYRRQELIARIGFFLALAPSLSGAFGGLLASGFLKVPDRGLIVSWRKIFFYEGIVTTVVGIAALWLLPTWPEKTRMFTDEERRIAIARVHNEQADGLDENQTQSFWVSFKKAFTVHSTLCIVGYSCINVSVAGLSTFMPTVVRTLGTYGTIEIQLRTVPPFAVSAVWAVLISYLSWKMRKRGLWIMISIPLGILGYVFFVASMNPQLRYAGCFLCFTGVVPLGPFFLSWGLNNVPGPKSRAITAALIPGLGTLGSIVSTWCYTTEFAPRYLPGNAINLVTTSAVFIIAAFLTWYVRWENKRRDRGELDYVLEGLTPEQVSALGHKHPHFRFVD